MWDETKYFKGCATGQEFRASRYMLNWKEFILLTAEHSIIMGWFTFESRAFVLL